MSYDETKEYKIRSIARDSVAWVMEYHSRHSTVMLNPEEIGTYCVIMAQTIVEEAEKRGS